MSTLVLRTVKGSSLTSAEIDANVINLNADKADKASPTFTGAVTLPNSLLQVTASSYPTIQPSLNLDFANTKLLDPRITFVRNSTATYYDGQTTAMAEQNLLTYSQDFRNTADAGSTRPYIYTNITNTYGAAIAPDGTTTANYLQETATTDVHILASSPVNSVTLGATAALSITCYFKKGLGLTAPDWIQISTGGASSTYANFNLTTGLVGNYGGGSGISVTNPINVGAGWYRCIVTLATAGSGLHYFYPGFTNNTNPTSRYPSYLGIITSDVQIWGFQIEQRPSATAYTPTTTSAITNCIPVLLSAPAGAARVDCDPITGKGLGLLIEESRTNLLNFSSSFATSGGSQNNWADTNITRTAAAFVAPDSTQGGIQFTASAANATVISTAAVGTSLARTFSVWLKRISGTGVINYTLDNGATWIAQTITPTVTRYTFTATTANQQVGFQIVTAGDGIGIWGAQLEAGSFATSYIPTVATTITRAADQDTQAIQVNAYTGSIKLEFIPNHGVSSLGCPLWSSYISASNYSAIFHDGTNMLFRKRIAGTNYDASIALTYVAAQLIKVAVSWSNVNINIAVNGVLGTANTNTLPLQLSSIQRIGALEFLKQANNVDEVRVDGSVKNIAYYPIALSTSNLVALTS